jgi:hypothetical protein
MGSSIAKVVAPTILIAAILAILHQGVLAAIVGLLGILVLVGITMRVTADARQIDYTEDMDAESRTLFAPVRRLTNEIEELVAKHGDSAIMRVVGNEAIEESRRIRDQVAKALSVRDDLRKAARDRSTASMQITSLQAQIATEQNLATKESLQGALEARKLELSHYDEVDKAVAGIDSGVKQAQAALSEMKARLSVKASNEKAALATDDDELRETIGRMKTLSISYDEAEQLLQ